MSIQETQNRVDAALSSFGDNYEFRWETHINGELWRRLKNTIELFGSGITNEEQIKNDIRDLRNASEVGFIDFHIRVVEPAQRDFNRMALLFERPIMERLTKNYTPEQRQAYLAEKIKDALRFAMANRQQISEKLKQQFTALVLATKEKDEDLAGLIAEYENYNPYRRKLAEAPSVSVNYDKTFLAADVPPEPAFNTTTPVDNSSFESRLPPVAEKAKRVTLPRPPLILGYTLPTGQVVVERPEQIVVVQDTSGNLAHHEEFAAFCEEIYAGLYKA